MSLAAAFILVEFIQKSPPPTKTQAQRERQVEEERLGVQMMVAESLLRSRRCGDPRVCEEQDMATRDRCLEDQSKKSKKDRG